jgi:hypothetical protein
MNDDESQPTRMQRIKEHRFFFMILGSISASVLLVLAALALYVSSGTAQLDLSRPGYAAIREQIKDNDEFSGFSSDGELDKKALQQFDDLYMQKLKDAQAVDAFGNDVLSPQSLQIDNQSATTQPNQ